MKKILFISFLFLLPQLSCADAVEINGIYYSFVEKVKTATVTSSPNKYKYEGDIEIPNKVSYNGVTYDVVAIGDYAFESCYHLTSISIPNSVTSFGTYAFMSCIGLKSIEIPNSVTSFGSYTFMHCTGLTSISIPNSITCISLGTFALCKGLTTIIIPNSVTVIFDSAFSGCSGLQNIEIPNSVTEIGRAAFEDCSGLTSINIPNSVNKIDNGAFSGCNALTSITIPNSVTEISSSLLSGCSSLNSLYLGDNVNTIGSWAFSGCKDLYDVYCYTEKVPETYDDIFRGSYIEYATLHVPKGSINDYKAAEPWKNFKSIVEIVTKCATPTIDYENGKLIFNCETEGATCQYTIVDDDIRSGSGNELQLTASYKISVYASVNGMENFDIATATLCWIDAEPKTEGINNSVAQVNARAVMIKSSDGILNINGVEDGTDISVYSVSGEVKGSMTACGNQAIISTDFRKGEVAIIKIGDKSFKFIVQ